MKQKISKELKDGWKEAKEIEEKSDYNKRKKIYNVYTKQIGNNYPSPIERGLFRTFYLCPVCNTELDKELHDAGILTICSECEYEYLDIPLNINLTEMRVLVRILEEFEGEKIDNEKKRIR